MDILLEKRFKFTLIFLIPLFLTNGLVNAIYDPLLQGDLSSPGYDITPKEITWWGGDDDEGSVSATIDDDGNFYFTCFSESFGLASRNVFVVKYDENMTLLWNTTWVTSDDAQPSEIEVDSNGDIIIAGTILTEDPAFVFLHNVFVLKFNASTGENIWETTQITANQESSVNCMVLDNDNNIYVAGVSNSTSGATFIQKFDSDGDFVWQEYYGTTSPYENSRVESIALDSSGNIYLGGTTDNSGGNLDDILLAKLDDSGDYLWNTTFGGSANIDWGSDIVLIEDDVYLVGTTESLAVTPLDSIVVKYNSSGYILWNQTLNYSNDGGSAITSRTNGNIVISGNKDTGGANGNYFAAEYTADGALIWNSTWESGGDDQAQDIVAFDHHKMFVIGSSYNTTSSDYDITIVSYYDPSEPPGPSYFTPGVGGIILTYILLFGGGSLAVVVIVLLLVTYFTKEK